MRYRIGSDPQEVQQQADGMIVGSALFGLVTGIIFVAAGWRARQFWLVFWGAGLVIASVAYLLYTLFK